MKFLKTVKMNGKRMVKGVMRGYDQFMNLTLGDAVEISKDQQEIPLGTVVCFLHFFIFFSKSPSKNQNPEQFIRGNSIEIIECLEPL